jgi:hypothetical protein
MESSLVVTYKQGTFGDIPATEVLIKSRELRKHKLLTRENNDAKQDFG